MIRSARACDVDVVAAVVATRARADGARVSMAGGGGRARGGGGERERAGTAAGERGRGAAEDVDERPGRGGRGVVERTRGRRGRDEGDGDAGGDVRGVGVEASTGGGGELDALRRALASSFTFAELDEDVRGRIASEMFLISVEEGTILMEENEPGDALYLIESGEFDVLQNRLGADIRVVSRGEGDIIGELALLYSVPRTATVRATKRSAVWVCMQEVFKREVKHGAEATTLSKNIFLEQVPVLSTLPIETRKAFADAMEMVTFEPYKSVMSEGDASDGAFYLINSGRAAVYKRDPDTGETRTVNHLFRHDFFGESETFRDVHVREYTVSSTEKALSCYRVNRDVVLSLLSSVGDRMLAEKSQEKVRDRMRQLRGEKSWREVQIRLLGSSRIGGKQVNITMPARVNPRSFGTNVNGEMENIDLAEKELLGGGTGGCVYKVVHMKHGLPVRSFALKRVRKLAVMEAPSHIFCEKEVTSEISHFTLMCQHASFQDRNHLYMLFDFMDGCDLMDMLSCAVHVRMIPTEIDGEMKDVRTQIGMSEDSARYYCAMIVLAFEYLHANQIIYRDLKPENVLVSLDGRCKLGDFGYSRKLDVGERAFTFCGTPGYVAPEICLSKGYGYAIDWWALGVLTYVITTSRQPFSLTADPSQRDDPLKVMRRIVDMMYKVQYPTYASEEICDFMSQLLQRNAAKRLGNTQGGVSQIKNHPWFAKFDWELLESGNYKPRPLTLSQQFLHVQRERLLEIERDQLLATEVDSSRGPNDASMNRAWEVFKEF